MIRSNCVTNKEDFFSKKKFYLKVNTDASKKSGVNLWCGLLLGFPFESGILRFFISLRPIYIDRKLTCAFGVGLLGKFTFSVHKNSGNWANKLRGTHGRDTERFLERNRQSNS